MDYRQMISDYFQMWVTRDFTNLNNLFAPDIYYSECYGPKYYGMEDIDAWILRQLEKQVVLRWDIESIYFDSDQQVATVTWYFQAKEENLYAFNGCSVIAFNDNQKISSIREFSSVISED